MDQPGAAVRWAAWAAVIVAEAGHPLGRPGGRPSGGTPDPVPMLMVNPGRVPPPARPAEGWRVRTGRGATARGAPPARRGGPRARVAVRPPRRRAAGRPGGGPRPGGERVRADVPQRGRDLPAD